MGHLVSQHVTPREETWDAVILTFLAEIGDKSFWAAAVLSVWCPLTGLRSGHLDHVVFFVFLGSFAALCLRVLVCTSRVNIAYVDCLLNFILLICICSIGRGVAEELNSADDRERLRLREEERQHIRAEEGLEARDTTLSSARPSGSGNQFLGGFKPYSPPSAPPGSSIQDEPRGEEGYGAVEAPPAAYGRLQLFEDDFWQSAFIAFVIPLFVVFTTDATDKSNQLVSNICLLGGWVQYGIVAGFFLAMVTAILTGRAINWMLSEQRKLFVICCSLVILGFAMMSDAILLVLHHTFRPQLDPTNPSPDTDVTSIAFLGSKQGLGIHAGR